MLFSSPVQLKQLLSLDLRPTTTTNFFSFSFSFGLLSRPKNVTIINYNAKTACCAPHKRRRRTPDRNNAQEGENNALKKEKKKGDRRETKEGRKEGRNLELFFRWLSIAKTIFLNI